MKNGSIQSFFLSKSPHTSLHVQWMKDELKKNSILPRSQMGKAIRYSLTHWEGLTAYLYDGMLEIDNNLIENAIRPVALGRKNYLFAGSHDAAQRAVCIYSFFAICKKHEVNPADWLRYVFEHIMDTKVSELGKLYPQNCRNSISQFLRLSCQRALLLKKKTARSKNYPFLNIPTYFPPCSMITGFC